MEVTTNNIDKLNYYDVKAISNSALTALNPEEGGNPAKFRRFMDGLEEKEETKSMELGTMIHSYIENEDNFAVAEFDAPSEMMCQWVDYVVSYEKTNPFTSKEDEDNTIVTLKESLGIYSNIKDRVKIIDKFNKEGNDYRQFKLSSSDKVVLSKDTKLKITNAIASIKAHTIAKEIFAEPTKNQYKEKEIFFDISISENEIRPAKAKIDWFSVDIENKVIHLIDIKTGAFTIGEFPYKFKSRHIYRQMYFYIFAIDNFIKKEFDITIDNTWMIKCEILAVSVKEDFKCAIFKVDDRWLDKGRQEMISLISQYIIHEEHGYEYFAEEYINNFKLELEFNE